MMGFLSHKSDDPVKFCKSYGNSIQPSAPIARLSTPGINTLRFKGLEDSPGIPVGDSDSEPM